MSDTDTDTYHVFVSIFYPALTGFISYLFATTQAKNNLNRNEVYSEKSDLVKKCHELKHLCYDYWHHTHDATQAHHVVKQVNEIQTRLSLLQPKFKLTDTQVFGLEQSGVNLFDIMNAPFNEITMTADHTRNEQCDLLIEDLLRNIQELDPAKNLVCAPWYIFWR